MWFSVTFELNGGNTSLGGKPMSAPSLHWDSHFGTFNLTVKPGLFAVLGFYPQAPGLMTICKPALARDFAMQPLQTLKVSYGRSSVQCVNKKHLSNVPTTVKKQFTAALHMTSMQLCIDAP